MNKTVVVLVMLVVVALALAGGTAFIIQQNRLSEFKRWGVQAREKIDAGETGEAISLLKKVEDRGGTAESATMLGKLYYNQGKTSDAMKLFDRVTSDYARSSYASEATLYKGRYALEVEGQKKKAQDIFVGVLEKYKDTPAADYALYYLARMSNDEGNIQQAKKNLDLVVRQKDSPARDEAEFLLGDINMKLLLSSQPGPGDEVYTIKKGDSLWKMERALKVPQDVIVGINKLRPNALKVGQQIKVPRLDISIVIDKAQRTLTVRNNGTFLKKYHVGINQADNRVPAGDYVVGNKENKGHEYVDPDSGASVKAGDPDNPLGAFFMPLRRDMGIHGTNEPDKVGKYIAKGYIAMTNQDAEELYTIARTGTPVKISGRNLQEAAPEKKQP